MADWQVSIALTEPEGANGGVLVLAFSAPQPGFFIEPKGFGRVREILAGGRFSAHCNVFFTVYNRRADPNDLASKIITAVDFNKPVSQLWVTEELYKEMKTFVTQADLQNFREKAERN